MMFLLLFVVFGILDSSCGTSRRQTQDTRCYGDYGCFHKANGLPVSQSPEQVNTVFKLHRRGDNHVYNLRRIILCPCGKTLGGQYRSLPSCIDSVAVRSTHFQADIKTWQNHVNPSIETKIIVHGFMESSGRSWIIKTTSELLKKGDYNVIVIDWRQGASAGYAQSAANTFLVGAELAYMLKHLRDNIGLNLTDVHLIGHSLGAQISGHAGRTLPGLARISALDPAAPSFSGNPPDRRLDASDATFVDVIHTDAANFVIVSGYGVKQPIGHLDFYPNGGKLQPGCPENIAGALGQFLGGHLEKFVCSHTRSTFLYAESINSVCKFYGHTCANADTFEGGNCTGCPPEGCPIMGFEAVQSNLTGSFYLSTSGTSPFCGHEYFVDIKVADQMPKTYGEFIITLIGTKGRSEQLKFESEMHFITHGDEETHVIATHNDVGTVTSLALQFVKARNSYGNQVSNNITVQSVKVVPASTNQGIMFCPNGTVFNAGQTYTLSSNTGCT